MATASNPLAAGVNLGVPVISAPSVPTAPSVQTPSQSQNGSIVSQGTALSPVTQATNPGVTVGNLGTVNPTIPATGNTGSTLSNILGSAIFGPQTTPGSTSQAVASAANSALTTAVFGANSGITWGRIGAFVLGLMLIGAGLIMLKPGQSIVVNAGRAARAIAA